MLVRRTNTVIRTPIPSKGEKGERGETGPAGSLTTVGPFSGPSSNTLTERDLFVLVDPRADVVELTFPSGVDGALMAVKSVSSVPFLGTNIVINTSNSQTIEDPALPGAAIDSLLTANFVGNSREVYTWIFSDKVGSNGGWVIESDYNTVTTPTNPYTLTRTFTVEDGYSVAQDDVISISPITGNAIPGYTYPGTTNLPEDIFDLENYITLDAVNRIVVGYTNTYAVLIQLGATTVDRPTYGSPHIYSSLNAGDEVKGAIRLSDDTFALLFQNTGIGQTDAKVVSFRSVTGTVNFPVDAQSVPLSVGAVEVLNTMTPSIVKGDETNGEMVVAYTDVDFGTSTLRLKRFTTDLVGTPPVLANFASQNIFTSSGTGTIASTQAEFITGTQFAVNVLNSDGVTDELLLVTRTGSSFTLDDTELVSFTLPAELGRLDAASSDLVVLTAESGRHKTYVVSGTSLNVGLGQADVFFFSGPNIYTGDLRIVNLEGTGDFIATAVANNNTGVIVRGTRSLNAISWGQHIMNDVPYLGSPAFINESTVSARVYFTNNLNNEINGLASISINGSGALSMYSFEGLNPIAISHDSAVAGEVITATIFGIHEVSSIVLTPGVIYYADTNGKITTLPDDSNVQFKEVAQLGYSLSSSSVAFMLHSLSNINYV